MEKLKMHTANKADENFAKLAALFPNAVTEAVDENGDVVRAIDKDILMQEISTTVVEGRDERYQFTWPNKRDAILLANAPIGKTLRPVVANETTPTGADSTGAAYCSTGSVNFDTTENLYIEGDNLDVLKLLQETYLSKVKMIYIDPPYNTGNDFVYEDDFAQSTDEYMQNSGQYDAEGNRLFKNNDSNGRFHTDWLNMIYPRLKLAKDLLRDDGVAFISIDDAELYNLKKIADEIFGEDNYVATLVYDKNRKNDAKYFSVGHEYMLVYFKNTQVLFENGTIFRAPKEGVEEVKTLFYQLREKYHDDWDAINGELKNIYRAWAKDDPRKPLARFTKLDEQGPYRDDGNISWPGGGGPKYEVLHPVTGKACKIPDAGWRFPNIARMNEEIVAGRVVFGEDEKTLPRIRRNLFQSDSQVMRSVTFSYAQTATIEFNAIFNGRRVFENPKPLIDIKQLIAYVTEKTEADIILDFFSGSATAAHAVMQLNAEDSGNRKYICVQLPETTDDKSVAYKSGYKTICEIGKDRIRLAGAKIKAEVEEKNNYLQLGEEPRKVPDIGFRVLKLDSTNMKDVYYNPSDYDQQMLGQLTENIKEDRTAEDLLFQVMLELGVLLSSKIEQYELAGKTIFDVADGYLVACFDNGLTDEIVTEIAKKQPYYFVTRDNAMDSDSVSIDFEQIFETYSKETIRKVL